MAEKLKTKYSKEFQVKLRREVVTSDDAAIDALGTLIQVFLTLAQCLDTIADSRTSGPNSQSNRCQHQTRALRNHS